MIDLWLAMTDLSLIARPSYLYCRKHGLDWREIVPASGGVFLSPIRVVPPRFFEPDPDGQLAAWCEVRDEDALTPLDVVAWSLTRPEHFVSLLGRAPALGMEAAVNPATYFGDAPLQVFPNPLLWLQGNCRGVVLLDEQRGARWLLDVPASRFAVADDGQARAIHRVWTACVDSRRIVVPIRRTAKAA